MVGGSDALAAARHAAEEAKKAQLFVASGRERAREMADPLRNELQM